MIKSNYQAKYINLIRGYSKSLFSIGANLNINLEYLTLLNNLNNFLLNLKLQQIINNNFITNKYKATLLINLLNDQLIIQQLTVNLNQKKLNQTTVLFFNFIKLLAANYHLWLIPKIFAKYEQMYLTSTNTLKIQIITAISLESNLQLFIEKQLIRSFNQKLLFNYIIDQTIIAGLIIKYQDQVIDISFKDKLTRLTISLEN